MTDYQRVTDLLTATPYLIVDAESGTAELAATPTFAQGRPRVVMHWPHGAHEFAKIVGTADREFILPEIGKIAGVAHHVVYHWMAEAGILKPSVRETTGQGRGKEALFSWADAFVAGVLGALRRQGVGLETLGQVSKLFHTELKRTARRVMTARRP
jgi:hypothetical protein